MKDKLFLIHWHREEAEALAENLKSLGCEIDLETEDGARASTKIKTEQPNAVIIYLTRLPSHGRETAHTLKSIKATREIPIIFVDGSVEVIEKTRKKIPGTIFTTSADLNDILLKTVRR
ncbi:hypothetical protein [[Eubacterium] cellulosolvens]